MATSPYNASLAPSQAGGAGARSNVGGVSPTPSHATTTGTMGQAVGGSTPFRNASLTAPDNSKGTPMGRSSSITSDHPAAVQPRIFPPTIIDGPGGRILCIADIRGSLSSLNQLAKETNAQAIIHTGDFGFYETESLERISERTLRHLVQYSTLIPPALRTKLLGPESNARPNAAAGSSANANALRQKLVTHPSPLLSEFPHLLTGQLALDVPVFTVWGACEDVAVLERFRTGEYVVPNLHILDEASTHVIEVGGVRLRLFGLGGAVVLHKLFDNGEGAATIAGGQGTMWTTILQIGELVDTAQKTYDPTETRLLVTHASPGREGLLAQLALALKADLTLSAGLHFRYGVSYNEFSVQNDAENFRNKLVGAKAAFGDVWETVRPQVEAVIDDRQRVLLNHALAVTNRVPPLATATGAASEEPAWKNTWNWNLPDAAYGNLVLELKEGRVSAETKSQGFNFAYRKNNSSMSALTPGAVNNNQQTTPNTATGPATNRAADAPPTGPSAGTSPAAARNAAPPSGPSANAKSAAAAPPSAPASTASSKRDKKKAGSATSRSNSIGGNVSGNESAASGGANKKAGETTAAANASSPATTGPKVRHSLSVSGFGDILPVTEAALRSFFGGPSSGIVSVKLLYVSGHHGGGHSRRGSSKSGAGTGTEDSGNESAATTGSKGARQQRPQAYVDFADAEAAKKALESVTTGAGALKKLVGANGECVPKVEQSSGSAASAGGVAGAGAGAGAGTPSGPRKKTANAKPAAGNSNGTSNAANASPAAKQADGASSSPATPAAAPAAAATAAAATPATPTSTEGASTGPARGGKSARSRSRGGRGAGRAGSTGGSGAGGGGGGGGGANGADSAGAKAAAT